MAYRDNMKALEDRISALESKLHATTDEKQSLEQSLTVARDDLKKLQRSASPKKRPDKMWMAVVGLIICMALFGVCILSPSESPGPPRVVKVPMGLKGLRFGMTPAEARVILKQIKPLPTNEQCAAAAEEPDRDMLHSVKIRMACKREAEQWYALGEDRMAQGPRVSVETLLFGEPARCTLNFSVKGGLSRMACSVDSPQHKGREIWDRITTPMYRRWGHTSRSNDAADDLITENRRISWENPQASLDVRFFARGDNNALAQLGLSAGTTMNEILITNTLRKHITIREAAEAKAVEEEERQRTEQQQQDQQEAERERQERIERIRRMELDPHSSRSTLKPWPSARG